MWRFGDDTEVTLDHASIDITSLTSYLPQGSPASDFQGLSSSRGDAQVGSEDYKVTVVEQALWSPVVSTATESHGKEEEEGWSHKEKP